MYLKHLIYKNIVLFVSIMSKSYANKIVLIFSFFTKSLATCCRAMLSAEDVCRTENFLDRLDSFLFPLTYYYGLKDKQ